MGDTDKATIQIENNDGTFITLVELEPLDISKFPSLEESSKVVEFKVNYTHNTVPKKGDLVRLKDPIGNFFIIGKIVDIERIVEKTKLYVEVTESNVI